MLCKECQQEFWEERGDVYSLWCKHTRFDPCEECSELINNVLLIYRGIYAPTEEVEKIVGSSKWHCPHGNKP